MVGIVDILVIITFGVVFLKILSFGSFKVVSKKKKDNTNLKISEKFDEINRGAILFQS